MKYSESFKTERDRKMERESEQVWALHVDFEWAWLICIAATFSANNLRAFVWSACVNV